MLSSIDQCWKIDEFVKMESAMADDIEDTTEPGEFPEERIYEDQGWPVRIWYEFRICMGFLTRLPVFSTEFSGKTTLAQASWAFSLVGLAVGLFGVILLWLLQWLGAPDSVAVLLALAGVMVVTGGLHEDGLADTADGFGAMADQDRKLEIMHDSRIGSFGVLALIISVGVRWASMVALIDVSFSALVYGFLAATSLSRGVLPCIMRNAPQARRDGLSVDAGIPESQPATVALFVGLVVLIIAIGFWNSVLTVILGAIVLIAFLWMAKKQIGGQTGDVLGASQQITEAMILIAATGVAL
jgi:adenosylcobinamide-GDP ribazoletransferase